MNETPNSAIEYIEKIRELITNMNNEVIICAPYIDLMPLVEAAKNTNIKIGAQNMHYEKEGAYTGEVSAIMLKEVGVDYVIIGHSERRAYYNETDESINKKLKVAFEVGLIPILCVGETIEQRELGMAREVVTNQTRIAISGLSKEQISKLIIAYEPIWAIGTGKTALPEDANEAARWIRKEIRILHGDIAEEVTIQYGGSVKSTNAKEIFSMPEIDGGLIGGASLDPVEFSKIINFDLE